MPILPSKYRAPLYLPGGTLQTIIPGRRKVEPIKYERETLELSDGDFLDLDWQKGKNNSKLIIATHGLEGSSQSIYINDLCRQSDENTYDILAWNCRSCSGRLNRLPKLYHHGEIEDISAVVKHALEMDQYSEIYLSGFSMGGNISVKFLALKKDLAKHIKKCGIGSTPCDLAGASSTLDMWHNFILKRYFKEKLRKKFAAKEDQFPGSFPMERFDEIKNWFEFDATFSVPFIGYGSVEEFYKDASANSFIDEVDIPTYLINAKNDPVLTPSCSPIEKAKPSDRLFIETPRTGGHAYFPKRNRNYAVDRILEFFERS